MLYMQFNFYFIVFYTILNKTITKDVVPNRLVVNTSGGSRISQTDTLADLGGA